MGVISFLQEFESPVDPDRLFKALILDSCNLCPKLLPQHIKSIDIIEGDGGVGSIKQINFAQGIHFKYAKYRIDELDMENFQCRYTITEGDVLGEKLKSIEYEMKFVADHGGGCICKMSSEYYSDQELEFKDEDIEFGKERATEIYKVVETYLLTNPLSYL
ncbi:hypothetical protein I3843_07G110800 [Carya illinoinensis]|uniref:Bet v I/Major latex protein domain-containing protein n=1 Tax=Carya illinoinensis TaxID=32201 RepID=A0A922JH43_CARIL|nr:hypothetical protein I3760_07G111200 [Carya illinoinensis]KAG6704019.1 hypothetical protein I3842_07G115400 [Carya illinoinensis]KAG7970943.1 hypothetical protein I3843_07G110800 [Carya illinoinensis]